MYTLLADGSNHGNNRDESIIKYIVIHYTANNGDTARNNLSYFSRPGAKASAHYFVDEKEVCQSVPDNVVAWHCGGKLQGSGGHTFYQKCTNTNSIGIELCTRITNGKAWFKDETVQNTIVLVRDLMRRYNIPLERVIRHYDVTGKECPKPFLEERIWADFKAMLVEDDEMIIKKEIKMNGQTYVVDTIFKDNRNFIAVRELEKLGIKVSNEGNMAVLTI